MLCHPHFCFLVLGNSMRSLFTPAINQPLNTLIDSATVTLSGIGTGVPFTLVSGTGTSAYKNGASITSTTLSDGDRVRIRVRSSTSYATPAFGVIKIGTEETVFAVSTLVDTSPVSTTAMETILPLDLVQYSDGREYIPSNINNVVTVFTAGALTKTIPLIAPQTNVAKTTDAVAIANYHTGQIFWLNDTLNVTAAVSPEANSKPYGIAVTGTSESDDFALTWVTLSGTNKVVVYDKNLSIVAQYPTGTKPLGICASADSRHVYVANHGSNTVTHFSFSNGVWTPTTIAVGSRPFEIAVDAQNNAWITHVGSPQVYRVSSADVATAFTLGVEGLRGITIDSNQGIWVAASKSNSISRLNAAGALTLTVPTSPYPYALSIAGDGSVNVSCFIDSKVESYNAIDGSLVRSLATEKYPYGVSSFGSSTLVANLFSNTPDYSTLRDQIATAFAIADPARVLKNTITTSSTFTVSGLGNGQSVIAAVPGDLLLAKLMKNGSVVGSSVGVVNGDTLAIQFTTPNSFDTFVEVPLFIGNVSENYTSRTEIESVTPNALGFVAVSNATINQIYDSNTVVVSGLSNGTSVPFSIDVGKIVLNGVLQTPLIVNVKNGDTLAIRVTTPAEERKTTYITTLAGKIITRADGSVTTQIKEIWSITTKMIVTDVWLRPEYKKLEEFVPLITSSSLADGKFITRISSSNVMSSLPVSNVEVGNLPGTLLIPSYYDGIVYQYSDTVFNALEAETRDHRPIAIADNRYVIYTGAHNCLFDVRTKTRLVLPAIPRKIVYSATTGAVYVSLSNGTVVDVRNSVISRTFTIGGSPYALAIDRNEGLWVSDLESDAVKYLVNGVPTKTISTGRGVWDIAVSSTHLWTANSYDNTISKINVATETVETIKVGSVPSQIELDSSGSVWIGHYGSKKVWRLDSTSNAKTFETQLQYSAPTYMVNFGGTIYITEVGPTLIADQNKISALTPLDFTFNDAIDELPGARIQSNTVTVANLIRPTTVTIQPDNGYDLYVNGVLVVGGSKLIDNGDTLYLNTALPTTFYTERILPLMDFQSTVNYKVRTETNVKPDLVSFADLYNAVPRQTGESNSVTITGMTPGHTTTVSVDRIGWKVFVNGVEAGDTPIVTNGDVLKLVGPIRGPYGLTSNFTLFAGKRKYVLGTFVVHTKTLDGSSLYQLHERLSVATSWIRATSAWFESEKALWEPRGNKNALYESSQIVFERALASLNGVDLPKFERMPSKATRTFKSDTNQFIRKVGSTWKHQSDPVLFERREYSETPTAAFVEYGLLESMNRFEINLPTAMRVVKVIHDVDAGAFQPTPSIFDWSSSKHESAIAIFEKQSGSDSKREAPISIYEKTSQNLRTSQVAVFEKTVAISQKTVVAQYTLRAGREYPTVNTTFEKRVVHDVYGVASKYERNAVRLQNTAGVAYQLHVQRSSFQISPASQYVKLERRTFQFTEVKEYDKNIDVYRMAQRNDFVRLPSPSTFEWALSVEGASKRTLRSWSAPTAEGLAKRSLSSWSAPTAEKIDAVFREFDVAPLRASKVLREVLAVDIPSFYKKQMTFNLVSQKFERGAYEVHNYTFAETPEIEGAYSSAAAAITAGVAAGYDDAYSVLIGMNKYIWAIPINTGNFCGVPIDGNSKFAMPSKWYVHGG